MYVMYVWYGMVWYGMYVCTYVRTYVCIYIYIEFSQVRLFSRMEEVTRDSNLNTVL